MKKYKNLIEAPLPDDWDHSVFDRKSKEDDVRVGVGGSSFKKILSYCISKSKRLGQGSSRVAFVIPYNGRDTVLKIAKNSKGLRQNQIELTYLNDYGINDILIPIIDSDEVNEPPLWIHMEKAQPMTSAKFIQYFGATNDVIITLFLKIASHDSDYANFAKKFIVNYDSDDDSILNTYLNTIMNYNFDKVQLNDLRQLKNWGIYDNQPVIIDFGINDAVYKEYYIK